MRLNNFFNESVEPVDEVAMNPTAYAQSTEQAQAEGVLVGFEFEVCVPAATISGGKEEPPEDKGGLVDHIIDDNDIIIGLTTEDLSAKDFDKMFKVKEGVGAKYPSMEATISALAEAVIANIKAKFYRLPEALRAIVVPEAKEHLARKIDRFPKLKNNNQEINFAQSLGYALGRIYFGKPKLAKKYSLTSEVINDIQSLAARMDDYEYLLGAMFGKSSETIQKKMSKYFDYDASTVFDELELEDYADSDYDDDEEDYDYTGAAKVLQPALEAATGKKVNVFNSYHQSRKNMTDWYIEPDGSLNPNSGDGAAEVVGPPELPQQALNSLKSFFGMAKQLNLYTNGSTGLHINVSIPKDIDVLKLAVFTGDQYVLQQFGRMQSSYARSVTRDITQQDNLAKAVTQKASKKPGLSGQPLMSTNIKLAAIQKIARDISNQHTASISYDGKYVSFRQVGGDYLNNYEQIVNVVGRFVRAMVIAADPNAYRNEYMAAVAKLAIPNTAANPIDAQIADLQKNGLPVATVYVFRDDKSWSWKDIIDEVHSTATGHTPFISPESTITAIEKSSQRAKQKLMAYGFDYDDEPVSSFATITAIPVTTNAIKEYNLLQKIGPELEDGYFDGYFVIDIGRLPPTDPNTQRAILNLRKSKLGKK